MKKQLVFLIILATILSLSSCNLFCKHEEYDERLVAPTCVAEGYTEHTCKKCGKDSYKDNYLPLIQHYFFGAPCTVCGMQEITENIAPDVEWYSVEQVVFNLTTKEQLAGFASLVNSGTSFKGQTVYLDADIDLGFYEWIPIGDAEHPFNGAFDGDGHTVTGLKINSDKDYVGFFGNSVGKISNLNIDRAIVYVKRDHKNVAIACGYTTTEIKNVSVKGHIEAPKSNCVGAIVGAINSGSIIYSDLTAKASINAVSKVGGIFGSINCNGSLQTDNISFIGKINGTSEVGGIVGYAKANVGSKIYGATACADIKADYYIGGIAGKLDDVGVSSCKNDGSKITSQSYFTEGDKFYAWIGGYAGYAFSVDNCVNNVDITYNARGWFVGGIVGFARHTIEDCTNNGNITAYTNYVGGIAGEANCTARNDTYYKNLTNNGNIEGKDCVGGIAGSSWRSIWAGNTILDLQVVSNYGNVTGENNVGGIIGEVDNYNSAHNCWLSGTNISNLGSVSGVGVCGEIFGRFVTDTISTLADYTVTGKITINGELREGEYDVGANTNLTLTDRKVAEN